MKMRKGWDSMMVRTIGSLALRVCLISVFFAGSSQKALWAQGSGDQGAAQSPVESRGTAVNGAFQFGGMDSVNLFNGNLTLSFPLGPTIPAGGSLSYGLTLVYNSNIWEYAFDCVETGAGGGSVPDDLERFYKAPDPLSNAGLGWSINPGMILGISEMDPSLPERNTYVAPDGSRHEFYPTLHPGMVEEPQVAYSRDGSYLRLRTTGPGCEVNRRLNPPSSSCELWIDFPNGSVHHFTYQADEILRIPNNGSPWRVADIQDAFGNPVSFDYGTADVDGARTWTISDQFGRSITVDLEARPTNNPEEGARVASVTFPAFGNPAVTTYQFNYLEEAVDRYRIGTVNPGSIVCGGPGPEEQVVVSHLTRIEALGTDWSFGMSYYVEDPTPLVRSKSGAIQRLRLPTGGGYGWEYSLYRYEIPAGMAFNRQYRPIEGVSRKVLLSDPEAPNGGVQIGEWTYEHEMAQTPAGNFLESPWDNILLFNPETNKDKLGVQPCYTSNKVTDPEGNYTVNYFQTARVGLVREFGQPYTVCSPDHHLTSPVLGAVLFDVDNDGVSDGVDPLSIIDATGNFTAPTAPDDFVKPTRYLSKRIYDKNGVLLREEYVHFTFDGFFEDILPSLRGKVGYNPRLRYQQTLYCDDPQTGAADPAICSAQAHRTTSIKSDFDGFGNFRKTELSSTFGGNSRQDRFTYFNPPVGGGGYPLSAGYQPNQWQIPTNGKWVLGTSTWSEIVQAPNNRRDISLTLTCHDPTTGFLLGQRRVAEDGGNQQLSVQQGEHDFLVRYTPTSSPIPGHIEREDYFGGDGPSGLPLNGCAAPGTIPEYSLKHSYSLGARVRSDALDPENGAVFLNLANLSLDPGTSKVASSFDPAGVETRNKYDLLGRLVETCEVDVRVASTEYQYLGANDIWDPKVVQKIFTSAGGCARGGQLTEGSSHFDALGRLQIERRKIPTAATGSELVERYFEVNALGWPLRNRLWSSSGNGQAAAGTTFSSYDAFGRPGVVTNPDLSQVTTTYLGDRLQETSVEVQTEGGLQTRVEHRSKDGLGRMFLLEELDGSGALQLRTTYRYDEGGRLSHVCVNDDDDGALVCPPSAQWRVFNYDGRGLQKSENHPELGIGGGGSKAFEYDSRGNILFQWAPDPAFDLGTRYDAAGRAVQIYQPDGRDPVSRLTGPLMKELFFARTSSGADLRAGKLVYTKRHNDVPLQAGSPQLTDVVVSETFTYADPLGRLTGYSVRASSGASFSSSIDGYDALGNVLTQTYPECTTPGCEGIAVPGPVGYSYREGILTGVPGFAPILEYHPNGQLARLKHQNNVQDFYALDANGWRLDRIAIKTLSGATLWEKNGFSYDPAGNVTGIGGDVYRYDLLGRLTRGALDLDGQTAQQDATYDVFGNLTDLTASGSVIGPSPGAIPVSTVSNRLDAPGTGYDANGNLLAVELAGVPYQYRYDAFDRMTYLSHGTVERTYLYTVTGERLATLGLALGDETYTPRSATQQVLRRYKRQAGQWQWDEDYIHAGTRPVATVSADGIRHLHLDHLGTTRRITGSSQQIVESNDFYPFGGYVRPPLIEAEELQFTGHERDGNGGDIEGDLDYMHARYHSPYLGRFLSVDSVLGTASSSQSWNRYSYSSNNPVARIDPDGRDDNSTTAAGAFRETIRRIPKLESPSSAFTFGLSYKFRPPGSNFVSARAGIQVEFSGGGVSNFGVVGEVQAGVSGGKVFDIIPGGFQADSNSGYLEIQSARLEVATGPLESDALIRAELQTGMGGLVVDESLQLDLEAKVRSKPKVSVSVKGTLDARSAVNAAIEFANGILEFVRRLVPEPE